MTLTKSELEFLSAWAREEWEPACYQLPAHRLQLAHGVAAASLMSLVKAWTEVERKRDHEILEIPTGPSPTWPWASLEEFEIRVDEARSRRLTRDQVLQIARFDAEKAYRDLTPFRVVVELGQDGWHVDYVLRNRQAQGGGAHYVIDAQTGQIRTKRYEQ